MKQGGNPATAEKHETQKQERKGRQDIVIPSRMFDDGIWQSLNPNAKDVYVQLRRYSNHQGLTRMMLPTLKNKAGVKTRQGLKLALDELKARGALFKAFKPGDVERFLIPGTPKHTWIFYT
jgi:hypothetical protein